jgi:hypothetical protein
MGMKLGVSCYNRNEGRQDVKRTVLRRISGSQEEVTRGLKNLHDELHGLYSRPRIVSVQINHKVGTASGTQSGRKIHTEI